MSRHLTHPLRKIVRREEQLRKPAVVLACGHAALGTPASRYSRFFPCPACHLAVEAARAALARSPR